MYIFIHLTDCRNTDVIHIELLLSYFTRHSSLSRNQIIVLRSFECLFPPMCIAFKHELAEEVLINYSGAVSSVNNLLTKNVFHLEYDILL